MSSQASFSNVCGWNKLSASPFSKRDENKHAHLFLFAACLMAWTKLEEFYTCTACACTSAHGPHLPGIHMHLHM